MRDKNAHPERTSSGLNWIFKISAASALAAGIILLVAPLSLVAAALQPQTANAWRSSLEDNWLIVIFKLQAGFSGVHLGRLQILNGLDLVILALVAAMVAGLYLVLRRASKIWSLVALVQPFLGIMIFLATHTAGRSTVMGAGLVISVVMLRGDIFDKGIAYLGILASVLLLVGDFSAGISPNHLIAALFGLGYLLLLAWFFLVARKLFQLGSAISPERVPQAG